MARRKKNKENVNSGRINKRRRQVMEEEYGEYAYGNEPETAITLDSLRRSKKYILISIVFFFLSLALVAGFMFMKNNTQAQNRNNCWSHQQAIEQLAIKYATDSGLSSLPAYIEDVPGFSGAQKECPSGGAYTWNPVTKQYYCSEHGHYPQGFNAARSINQGTQTTTVPNE